MCACDCPHSKFHKGYRSWGDNIPMGAWGAYFPGDEPHYSCRLTQDNCVVDVDPASCPLYEPEPEEEE